MSDPHANSRTWWKNAIVYQIYPISFFDSNGNGIGDLNGIHSKLDYLKDLGVDVLWLSPIYKSPLADMGYDISDYRDIDPRYGTLEDWDNLLKGVHERGMKLVMDLVVNHTSDEHAWFTESRSSKSSPKRDWYIWRPPKYDASGNRQPPNNWKSVFQGSAWDYDEGTNEYYLHLYVSKQPDLNWDNPDVRYAVYDMMKFWLDRGCDGFRMDVINLISKTDGLPDAPITVPDQPYQPASMYFANGPRVHQYIKEMRREVLSKYDILTVGETPFTHDASQLSKYVLPENEELNMVFQFELMDIDSPQGRDISPLIPKPWKLDELREIEGRWQVFERERGFWNAVFIENHDHARAVSRFGNTSTSFLQATSAKMIAILEIGQSGTQYIYQGQELGLKNFPRSWGVEEYKDVATINYWNLMLEKRRKETGEENPDMTDVLDGLAKKARDHARVPMQWNSSPQAGFTTGTPWMRVNDDYKEWNAESQLDDPESVRSFYKKAVSVRKENDVLIYGEYKDVSGGHKRVYAFTKTLGSTQALIMLNFGVEEATFVAKDSVDMKFVLGNYTLDGESVVTSGSEVKLKAYEGRLYIS